MHGGGVSSGPVVTPSCGGGCSGRGRSERQPPASRARTPLSPGPSCPLSGYRALPGGGGVQGDVAPCPHRESHRARISDARLLSPLGRSIGAGAENPGRRWHVWSGSRTLRGLLPKSGTVALKAWCSWSALGPQTLLSRHPAHAQPTPSLAEPAARPCAWLAANMAKGCRA